MTIYVSNVTGNDSTGDGSEGNPYKTIGKATTVINGYGDAGPGKIYLIKLTAGTYSEAVTLPSNVFIEGENGYMYQTIITSITFTNFHIMKNLSTTAVFTGCVGINAWFDTCDVNFNNPSNVSGEIASLIVLNSDLHLMALVDCSFYARNTKFFIGSLTNNVSGKTLTFLTCDISGFSIITPTQLFSAQIAGCTIGGLSLNTCNNLRIDSISVPKNGITLTNGAAYQLQTISQSVSFTPAVPSNWSVVPNNVKSALDTLAIQSSPSNISSGSYTTAKGTGSFGGYTITQANPLLLFTFPTPASTASLDLSLLYENTNSRFGWAVPLNYGTSSAGYTNLQIFLPGKYRFTWCVGIVFTTQGQTYVFKLFKTTDYTGNLITTTAYSAAFEEDKNAINFLGYTSGLIAKGDCVLNCSAGDQFQLGMYQTAGNPYNGQVIPKTSHFTVEYIP